MNFELSRDLVELSVPTNRDSAEVLVVARAVRSLIEDKLAFIPKRHWRKRREMMLNIILWWAEYDRIRGDEGPLEWSDAKTAALMRLDDLICNSYRSE